MTPVPGEATTMKVVMRNSGLTAPVYRAPDSSRGRARESIPGMTRAAHPGPYPVVVTNRARVPRNWVPWLVDATIAFGLSALSLLTLVSGAPAAGPIDPLNVTLLLLETLPLIFRRRWPIPVYAVTLGATVAHAFLVEGT